MLLQLALETREQGERVGGAAGKTGENLVLKEAADLARGLLEDVVAESDLAVASHHHLVGPAHAQNRRAAYRYTIPLHRHPGIIPRPALSTNACARFACPRK